MYVCICNAVTEREIQCCAEEGARSMRELRQCLGVASQCGKCARQARAILREAQAGASENALVTASLAA